MSGGEHDPEVSIVIPIHAEAAILESAVAGLCGEHRARGTRFEIILAENGSGDETVAIAERLAAAEPEVSTFSYPEPNYGGALREGILRARGKFVICEEIDLCDVEFHDRALEILRGDGADMVVGSKALPESRDDRPWSRRLATRAYNRLLRVALGFAGTDTHGLKAFRRTVVAPVASQCLVEYDVFASELVIRCERAGVRVGEIPVDVAEKRAPSIRLFARTPRVLRNVGRLWVSINLSDGRGTETDGSTGDG